MWLRDNQRISILFTAFIHADPEQRILLEIKASPPICLHHFGYPLVKFLHAHVGQIKIIDLRVAVLENDPVGMLHVSVDKG